VNVLAIDTATPYLVLGTLTAERALWRGRAHAETLMPDLDDFLRQLKLDRNSLDLLVVGEGPGSYTGLRVAAAAALGISRALGIPVVGASTLAAIARRKNAPVRAAIQARSGHYYTAAYDAHAPQPLSEPAKVTAENLPGDACLLVDAPPSGKALAELGLQAYTEGRIGLNSVYL